MWQANLGGWLGDTPPSHPRGLARLTAPLLGALHRAFQEPLLLSVVNLRDAVRAPLELNVVHAPALGAVLVLGHAHQKINAKRSIRCG